jgi:ERCC4-type nuclease
MAALIPTDTINLVVDTREHAVVPFLDDAIQNHSFMQKQINVGDYLICNGDTILASIERKTLADFGSSLSDGRYGNFDKMVELRKSTGCKLMLFIEGPAFPAPTRCFSRIPYANILAAINSLMIRDDMYVVYVADEQQTAIRLEQLMNVYSKELRLTGSRTIIKLATGGAGAEEVSNPSTSGVTVPNNATFPVLDFRVTPDDLLGLASQSDEHAVIEMWRKLPGISVATSKVLVDKYSINDVINLPVPEIRAITGTSGRKLSKSSADSLVTINPTKLLSGIRNVTAATADIILQSIGDLKTLSTITEIELSNIQLQQKTRTIRLGNVRAARILFLMQYKNSTTV